MENVLIVGSGGREHALGWSIGQSDRVSKVFYAPGNGGTEEGKGRNIPIDGSRKDNFGAIDDLIKFYNVGMVVVGPEQPLADGLVDFLHSKGHKRVFGPTQNASQLESDKFFSFDLMHDLGIPQARSIKCYTTDEAMNGIRDITIFEGVVIKARGLTGGKGVLVCDSRDEAYEEIETHFNTYGPEVLIAERLRGQEFSVFAISDGNKVSPLEISIQDHKPAWDGERGPNTGGMGAYGPTPIASVDVVKSISSDILNPIVRRMKEQGNEYKGFLYAGMMMTEEGPIVIEFNIRFGDPECQPAMMMLKNGLYQPLSLALEGRIDEIEMEFNPGASCCVVLASKGYPGNYDKGSLIEGLDDANGIDGVKVFHAGTKVDDGRILTSGGRVLGVTGYSPNGITEAQKLAYEGVSRIIVPGGFQFRTDIANKALG